MKNLELDRLPTEILFEIFDYLSSNDIIYAFFFFNQRFHNLLLHNQRYLSYFELPSTDLNTWKKIFSIIGSRIECLNITTNDLFFSLKLFSNLKSIIICSSYEFSNKQLENLETLKLKENKIFSNRRYFINLPENNSLFQRIFNSENSLKTLTISTFSITHFNDLKINFNLHSMTLNLISFENIFLLIQFTPNLEYLNINSYQPHENQHQLLINTTNIKLKQFYLTFHYRHENIRNLDSLINGIKHFSSSLICVSLNLIYLPLSLDVIPFNSRKLQQFLESMIELKQFYVYAQSKRYSINSEKILSQFQNEFWFNHNWSFGMHQNYFYTLPFHFDYLYEINSNNPEIFRNNSRIWSNVKSLEIERSSNYDANFVKELKIKMPKLNLIKFGYHLGLPLSSINDEQEKLIDLRLDSVTTVEFTGGSIQDEKQWIINSLPNLKHLILTSMESLVIDMELAEILNKRIQRLDINIHSQLKQLTEISYNYFSNVKYINFCLNPIGEEPEWYADYIMKILKNFKNLHTLLIYIYRRIIDISSEAKLKQIIEYLDMNFIMKDYQVKHFREYSLFIKRKFNDNIIQDIVPSIPSFFSSLIHYFYRKKRF